MRKTTTMSLTLAAVAAAFVPVTPAHAAGAPPSVTGSLCGYTSIVNPFGTNRQAGEIDGGPIVIADGADLRTGRLTCTIRVGTGGTHTDGTVGASVTSPTTAGVVALAPQVVEYVAGPADDVTLCTQVDIDGAGTFYWDDDEVRWSTDPNVVCNLFVGRQPFYWLLPPIEETIDAIVCPVLQAQSPGVPGVLDIDSEGDVALLGTRFWDCPPYGV